jgi:hypothetical protein
MREKLHILRENVRDKVMAPEGRYVAQAVAQVAMDTVFSMTSPLAVNPVELQYKVDLAALTGSTEEALMAVTFALKAAASATFSQTVDSYQSAAAFASMAVTLSTCQRQARDLAHAAPGDADGWRAEGVN